MPHVPSSPLTKLRQSQQKADLGILENKVYPVDGSAHNTHSQIQVQRMTQEAVLACIHNYGEVPGRPISACHTALRQFPPNMLHSVLDKTMGYLLEMRHLLVNPKYKGANPAQKNLDVLLKASLESAKVLILSFSSTARTFHTIANATSRMPESV